MTIANPPQAPPETGKNCHYAEVYSSEPGVFHTTKDEHWETYYGECPRCEHETHFAVPIGAGLKGPLSGSTDVETSALMQRGFERITVGTIYCLCGYPHASKPPSATDEGCGAFWVLGMTRADPPKSNLLAKRWAQRAQTYELKDLEQFRKSADLWRNGLAGLATLLGIVAIVRGPSLAADIQSESRGLVIWLMAVGMALLVGGTLFAMNAAFGIPVDGLRLSGEDTRRWERKEIRVGQRAIILAKILFFVGIAIVVAAVVVASLNQAPGM